MVQKLFLGGCVEAMAKLYEETRLRRWWTLEEVTLLSLPDEVMISKAVYPGLETAP